MEGQPLLNFMEEQFESICFRDLGYLENICFNMFA